MSFLQLVSNAQGLQTGQNLTGDCFCKKNITQLGDINLNYMDVKMKQ
jgi:hypothetical protein